MGVSKLCVALGLMIVGLGMMAVPTVNANASEASSAVSEGLVVHQDWETVLARAKCLGGVGISCTGSTRSAEDQDCANGNQGYVRCDGVTTYCPCPCDVDLACDSEFLDHGCAANPSPSIPVNSCTFSWSYSSAELPYYWFAFENHAEVIMWDTCSPHGINTIQVTTSCSGCPLAPITQFENLVCDPPGGGGGL